MTQGIRQHIIRGCTAAVLLAASAACLGWKQQAPAPQSPSPSPSQSQVASDPSAGSEDRRSSKQKLLEDDAERLVTMATQLKVEVDKTNKNILSLTVVQKAEEIEALAHRMKGQGKR